MNKDALKGVRVADFSWVWAGPYATSLLAYLGAEVVKIESRKRIDQTRTGSIMNGDTFNDFDASPTFNNANLNKKGVSIDIKTAEGVELAKKIVAESDVVVVNMRPGTMDRLGLGYRDLIKVKPDIIMIESSGFGSGGPYGNFAGFAPIFASFGGLAYLTGYGDGVPNTMSGVMDLRVGTASAFIIIAALLHRSKTGRGQYIDLSSSECISALIGPELMDYTMNKRSPFRCGNEDAIMAPHQCYRCKGEDKWVSIAVATDEEWRALRAAMGDPDWAKADAYADAFSRWQNRKALDRHMAEWTRDYTPRQVMELLQGVGVAAMPSFSASEILEDPHFRARGMLTSVEHPVMGEKIVINPPWKLSETPAKIKKPAPLLGEDNEEIFGGLLGMPQEEIKRLQDEQIMY